MFSYFILFSVYFAKQCKENSSASHVKYLIKLKIIIINFTNEAKLYQIKLYI